MTKYTQLYLAPLLGACALLCAPFASADDDDGKAKDDPFYSSFRLTHATADFDNLDSAFNLGYSIGFRLPDLEFLAAELSISSTVIPGENKGGGGGGIIGGGGGDNGGDDNGNDDPPCLGIEPICLPGGGRKANTASNDELLMNTLAIFARIETPSSIGGRFFASARVGYAYVDTTIDEIIEDGRGSTAFGLGFGYRYGSDGRVELSYSQMHEDLQYISLAISY